MPRSGFFLLMILFGNLNLQSQPAMPVRISVFNESTSIPFTRFFTAPVHPGIEAGTALKWKEKEHWRLYPSVSVGYLFHNKLYQAVYLQVELNCDYVLDFGLCFKSSLGVGYMHTFTTQQEFSFENGVYESRADKGNSRFMPSLSLGLGYRLQPAQLNSAEIFVMYQAWAEYPYSPGFIPIMTHTNLHLGSVFYPFK
jgi:hypothetical protein